jgi:hypothetical protein
MNSRYKGEPADFVTDPQCFRCRHYHGKVYCTAFKDGIPGTIMTNIHDHRNPYFGDNGIRFEPIRADNG